MANQIDKGFAALPHDQAVAEITAHIKSFWEQRMLTQIFSHLDKGGAGLNDRAKQGLQRLRKTAP
jgi:formate dehydrogenase subunit delta